MSSFDLRRLRYFAAVAELGSVTRAASELHVAQPALSQQVHLLEEEIGGQLFARSPQGVRLTELGKKLLDESRVLLKNARAAQERLKESVHEPEGLVVVGLAQTVGPILAPLLVKLAAERLPRVHIQLRELMSSDIPDLLRAESLDFALSYAIPSGRGIRSTNIFSETLYLVGTADAARKCLPHIKSAAIPFSELKHVPLYLSARKNGFREYLERLARVKKIKLNVAAEVDSVAIRKDIALSGVGFTVLSGASIRKEILRRSVFALPIADPLIQRKICFFQRSGTALTRASQEVATLIMKTLLELVSNKMWPGARLPEAGLPKRF